MSWHEAEPARHVRIKHWRAHKDHHCEGCRTSIFKGDMYFYIRGIDSEGEYFVVKMHQECHAWYEALTIFYDYFGAGLAYDASLEAMQEMGGEADVSDAYRVYVDLWVKLDALCEEGRGDTTEADQLRDAMDAPWHKMYGHDRGVFERFVRRFQEYKRGT